MRTLALVLSVLALAGVAWLFSQGGDRDPQAEATLALTARLDAIELQLRDLATEVALLTRQRKEEGPRLLGATPLDQRSLAELRRQVAALEARQAEARERMDRQDERLQAAAPSPKKAPKTAAPDPAAVDRWLALLEHEDEDLVFSATLELAKLGDLRATDPLIRVLTNHKDFYARLGAGTALGELGATGAVPALIDALNDKDDLVRTASAEALRRITKHSFKFVPGLDQAGRARIQTAWRDWWQDNADAVGERLRQSR